MSLFTSSLGRSWIALLGVFYLAGCAQQKEAPRAGIDPKLEVQAPANIQQSFNQAGSVIPGDNSTLIIKKDAFEKEFLLSASIIPQSGSPTSEGLKARIIAFRKYGSSVFMLEATQGHVVTRDLPAQLILAELPIIEDKESLSKKSEEDVIVDFNAGMKKVFTTGSWYASDDDGKNYDPNKQFSAVDIGPSFIDSIKLDSHQLEIRQIAQIVMPQEEEEEDEKGKNTTPPGTTTIEARYFITPYLPKKDFIPRETSDFKLVGFFENPPLLEETTGRSIVRITRWDDSAPLIYSISSNTPAEFVDAVKEGILYWNKAFGRELIKAEMAPEEATAPDAKHNIVQWVPWNLAGFAYADGLMDPRSGEIMHAQVYMTSAFAVSSRKRAIQQLRLLQEAKAQSRENKLLRYGMKFLSSSRLCDYHVTEKYMRDLQGLITSQASDEQIKRVSQNYIKLVVAHEIGHTLGLRHNFAGSLAANVDYKKRQELYRDFLINGKTPDPRQVTLVSSVMEYAQFEDDVLVAAMMDQMDSALPYDLQAVQWGYRGRVMSRESAPLFCTDTHMQSKKYADCMVFDYGSNPMITLKQQMETTLKQLAERVVERFILAKAAGEPRDRKPLDEVIINPAADITAVVALVKSQLAWFNPATLSLKIERRFPHDGPLLKDAILKAKNEWVAAQVETLGGVDRSLFEYFPAPDRAQPALQESWKTSLNAYLSRDDVKNGQDEQGNPYSLSDQEIEFIRAEALKYFAEAEPLFLSKWMGLLAAGVFGEPKTAEPIEQRLGMVAEKMILEQGDQLIDEKAKTFKYSLTLRTAAAQAIAKSKGPYPDWNFGAKNKIPSLLSEVIEKTLGAKAGQVDQTKLTRPLRHWYLEQMGVLKALGGGVGGDE